MDFYLRKVTLDLDGVQINTTGDNDLTISFSVERDLSGEANSGSITVLNLSESTRNALGKELDHVILRAGYQPPSGGGNVGTIFQGRIRDIRHTRKGPDIETIMECGDADQALRKGVVNKTFPKGSTVREVIEEIQSQFERQDDKVTRGEWLGLENVPPLKRAETLCGSCRRAMNTFGRSRKFYWSFQNEKLEIFPSDEVLPGQIVEITPESGMVDTPTITDNGVIVKALMNPAIAPGHVVAVRSQTLSMNSEGGEYRVSKCTYSGDNRDGDFFVTITGERLQGGTVDEGHL